MFLLYHDLEINSLAPCARGEDHRSCRTRSTTCRCLGVTAIVELVAPVTLPRRIQ
jgi:hypothetical protein